jgi:hypothetical protein
MEGVPVGTPSTAGTGSRRNGMSNYNQLVGDYTNPILQPRAAQIVKAYGEISLAGATYPQVLAQTGPVHFQKQRDADIAATPPGDDPLPRKPSIRAPERATSAECQTILA